MKMQGNARLATYVYEEHWSIRFGGTGSDFND